MAESKTTTKHGEIQSWVEERGGHPAMVKATADKKGGGLLRIDYPGFSGEETLEEISWDDFFETFDRNNLAFLYQEKTADGKTSRFSKLVDRETAKSASRSK